MRAIHFGAGNIGRGFIGKILADAGWSVTFADVNETLVGLIARDGRYPVDIVGADSRRARMNAAAIAVNSASNTVRVSVMA